MSTPYRTAYSKHCNYWATVVANQSNLFPKGPYELSADKYFHLGIGGGGGGCCGCDCCCCC